MLVDRYVAAGVAFRRMHEFLTEQDAACLLGLLLPRPFLTTGRGNSGRCAPPVVVAARFSGRPMHRLTLLAAASEVAKIFATFMRGLPVAFIVAPARCNGARAFALVETTPGPAARLHSTTFP
jgi:hypothetical protein